MTLKKVWLTPFPTCESLATLTLEALRPEEEHTRIAIKSNLFPLLPTRGNPLRNTVSIGLLDPHDLLLLRDAIDEYLGI